ncbi:MAG: phosphatase PAP2 family protein, partial [Pseudomonadota bacterium]
RLFASKDRKICLKPSFPRYDHLSPTGSQSSMQSSIKSNKGYILSASLCWIAIPLSLGALDGLSTPSQSMIWWPDMAALDWMDSHRNALLDRFFLAATWAGSLIVLLPLSMVLTAVLLLKGETFDAWLLALGLGGAIFLIQSAKQIFSRPRPALFEPVVTMSESSSFPSGHTAQIAVFSLCLAFIAYRSFSPRLFRWSMGMGILLTSNVGISRIYLQVHYPSDVLAACLLSMLWVMGLRFFLKGLTGPRL